MDWKDRKVLVTGGASFIGSHLTDALVERGARVCVADDLSSGRKENIQQHIDSGRIQFMQGDLKEQSFIRDVVAGQSTVFHLAANHGGRGYVDLHQAACATNLGLDASLFLACHEAGVEKVVYASYMAAYAF